MGMKGKKRPTRTQPETLRLRSLSVSLTVNDIHRSVAWYRDIVGFTVAEDWKHEGRLSGAELKAGTQRLVISQDDFSKGRDRVKGVGWRLVCHTRQDVDRIAADIKARGGSLEAEPADLPWGSRAFTLVDPDGFRITITS